MSLSALDLNTINKAAAAAKIVVSQLDPIIRELDTIYNAATIGSKFTITQGNLDVATQLSGITKQQLDDALFALTSTVKTAVTAGYVALIQLSARGG